MFYAYEYVFICFCVRCFHSGKLLGMHKGLWFHTVGQRKGLGETFVPHGYPPLMPCLFVMTGPLIPGSVHLGPWFVAAKDVQSNTLLVTNRLEVSFQTHYIIRMYSSVLQDVDAPRLSFSVHRVNWISGNVPYDTMNMSLDIFSYD